MPIASKFSVVLATYTGEEHIQDCLHSILNQSKGNFVYEVVVIIDGPNRKLRQTVGKTEKLFKQRDIPFSVTQFHKNRGRFAARLKGAELAKNTQLLFVDDRSILDKQYFTQVINSQEPLIIANAIEKDSPNIISRTEYLLRKKLYRGRWGEYFESFYVDRSNFEKTAKGTAGFWISRKLFLEACRVIRKSKNAKDVNEDTKLFKYLIDRNLKLYKSSQAKVYYKPRGDMIDELKHLYGRGPRFVDYYLKPGTRFFKHVVASLSLGLAALLLSITQPWLLLPAFVAGIGMLIIFAVILAEKFNDLWAVILSLPLIVAAFGSGVLRALLVKTLQALR